MSKTAAPEPEAVRMTVASIDQQLSDTETLRGQWENRRNALLQQIAADPAGNTSALVTELNGVNANLQALPITIGHLTTTRADAERAQLIADYEMHTATMHGIYTQVAAIDAEIATLQQRANELLRQRSDLNSSLQRPSGQRSKVHRRMMELGIAKVIGDIHKRYALPPYI